MKRIRWAILAGAMVGAHILVVANGAMRNEPVAPLPEQVADVEPAKARLGERLFSDTRLSADGSVSCRSCHMPSAGMADPRRHSVAAFGRVRALNSPTLLNVRFNTSGLNWTARTKDLEAQVAGAVGNPESFAHDWGRAIEALAADAALVQEFRAAYGGEQPVTQQNAMDAIVSFEKSLVTPSRFDDWLRGMDSALTPQEIAGYQKFKTHGCVGCHRGINLGGNSLARFPALGDYYGDRERGGRGRQVDLDKGRFLVTKDPADMHVFRVAPLRNVALTAPYFHDGAVPTLDEAIALMGRYQLGREIPPADRRDIEAFLRSLTGKELERAAVH